MATAGAKPIGCELVTAGILKLVDASCNFPEYTSIVVLSADILLVVDSNAFSLRLHSCHNGQLLVASGRLQARPHDAFVLYGNRNEVAVTLSNGQIDILLFMSTGKTAAIRQVRTLLGTAEFEYCHGVRALRSNNKLVVSGGKEDWICWGLVSHLDGHLDKIHKICKSGGVSSASYLAISPDDSIVYISCWTGPYYSKNNGIYAYDVMTGNLKFTYHSRDLAFPKGISVDRRGFIYVCNWKPTCIHQLTESMQLVTIHRKGMPPEPMAMYWEEQKQELYVTRMGSKEVWRLSPQWIDQQGDHKALEVLGSVERLQSVMEDISAQLKHGNNKACTQRLGSNSQAASLSEKDGAKSFVVPDNPITQDHFNHACLCYALTTVCADALREILLSQVPAPYTNIYQAILANQASLTRRRQVRTGQWQNVLLNQDQSQLVFPDPKGRYVGTVQQMDISLLYTLIRNVSKVPAPTTGWGNPPTDQPRETTLGASVERIRLYRNIISGHSVDGKINHQEFEDYWHKIDEVLSDIENIIGDHGYRGELEKCRNQDITPREPHEKRKKIRGYMKDPVFPIELINMDTRSLDMYKEALRDGKEKVYNIRVMVVGQYGVGKTTLTKRLLGKDVNLSERNSTDGIDVHVECSKVSLVTGEWTTQEKNAEQYSRLQRLVKFLNMRVQKQTSVGDQEGQSDDNGHLQLNQSVSAEQKINHKVKPPSSEPYLSTVVNMASEASSEQEYSKEEKKDAVIEILQLVKENSDKLEKSMENYAALTIWDFAGQSVFYTTHQTFLTSRAIYLLVIDLSQQIRELINDEFFFDTEGIKLCEVHELVDIWLNSIHSYAPSSNAGIPPVILVGTHVDKIPKNFRQKVIDEYFMTLRYMLKDKVTVLHVRDDIAIDNTYCDPKLEKLKRKIFQLASQQPYWGEEKPARWIPMEQAIMTLKASGVKVAQLSLLEDINRSGSVRIDGREEMELFLRFHHEIGTFMYFSVEGLRDIVVLDPQWLIDAQKSLITAEMFVRKNPAIIRKWCQFKEEGILTHELIDAVWSKERCPEFHDNKDHILQLMEHLNIIVKPRVYKEDGRELKVENYFLTPCMLREAAPEEVISAKPQPNTESSSVLCYAFVEKFLPSPIFHRLLAACIAHWPIAKKSNSGKLIYCCCCTFDLDLSHRLTIFFREYVIFVRVTRFGTTDKTPATKLCIDIREFITMTLSKVIGYQGKSLQFELFIQCPKSDGYSVDCLIPVKDFQENVDVPCHFHEYSHVIESFDMLKFWFHEKDNMDQVEQVHSEASDLSLLKDYRVSLERRALPPGKKYHVFFSYCSSDIQWVKQTIERLEKDHGFVCCEYDRDNTPGTPLLKFADDSIRNAYKTVAVMTREAFKSGFVLHEFAMAIIQGFEESRKCVVPVLLEDCEVPSHLSVLNYVDARDLNRGDIWWPKLLAELETYSEQKNMDQVEQAYSEVSNLSMLKECRVSLQRRALPPGKKYHVFFSYSSLDIQWVKKTVERLEKDHGFACCEFDRDCNPGTSLWKFASDSIRDANKTVVVMTRKAFKSDFVLHEIEMAIIQGFEEKRKCVVPVLLEDCQIPRCLRGLKSVDARDSDRRDIWWPKLLSELETYSEQVFDRNKRHLGKLHQTVLTRCLPKLMRALDVKLVCNYIQQKELFDDVTLRDILEESKTAFSVWQLIRQIQQRNQETYEKFKECLVLADQPHLKYLLDKEEAQVSIEMKETHEAQRIASAGPMSPPPTR